MVRGKVVRASRLTTPPVKFAKLFDTIGFFGRLFFSKIKMKVQIVDSF